MLLNRKVLFVELKTPTGKLSKRQELVFKQFKDLGFPVTIIRTEEEIERLISETLGSAPVSKRTHRYGKDSPEFGLFLASRIGEDDDIIDDTGGAV